MTLEDLDVKWIVRRLPKTVREYLESNSDVFVAGGFIRACISHEPVSDLDLFTTNAARAGVVAGMLTPEGQKPFQTANAITFMLGAVPVQLIHRWSFATPYECVQSFDFTIARAAIWFGDGWQSTCDPRFYADLAAKRLVYCRPVRNEDAGGSLLRVLKFYQKGYRIPLSSMGDVISRLMSGVIPEKLETMVGDTQEEKLSRVLCGLLKEVDPNAIEWAYINDRGAHDDGTGGA